jgi:hypothetical protein
MRQAEDTDVSGSTVEEAYVEARIQWAVPVWTGPTARRQGPCLRASCYLCQSYPVTGWLWGGGARGEPWKFPCASQHFTVRKMLCTSCRFCVPPKSEFVCGSIQTLIQRETCAVMPSRSSGSFPVLSGSISGEGNLI